VISIIWVYNEYVRWDAASGLEAGTMNADIEAGAMNVDIEEEEKLETVTMTRSEILQTFTTEELIQALKEQTPETAMTLICQKLQNYAKGLGETVEYGTITLSEEEMVSIRNFLKNEEPDDGGTLLRWAGGVFTWNSDSILGYEHDKGINIMGLGIWDYQGYKFVLHCNRNLLYLDSNTRKIIAITNSVDYTSDDGYSQFENLLWGHDPSERQDKLCNLQTTSECCFTYCETEEGIRIEKWLFGEKLHIWYGEKISGPDIWSVNPPMVVELHGETNGTHFIASKGNLLSFREGEDKIRLIAKEIAFPEDIVTVYFSKNTVYYACDNEIHMVCTETLEDVLLAEDFESELQVIGSVGSYAIYHDKNRKAHVVAGYFDENNKAVKSEKETIKQANEYEEKVMESLNNF
ncbi:MAG: hypothetical protein K2H53_00030, partial [Clostridia bacterium]|nr:hypothetical protein [Clostridia bacterium]